MQALASPLPSIPIEAFEPVTLSAPQSARLDFYLALIKLTRLLSGSVTVTIPPCTPTDIDPLPGAVLLWLPPHARPTVFLLWRSGFLYVLLRYGLTAIWHLYCFERDLETLNLSVLSPLGYKREGCGFVFMLAANPEYRGKSYAALLLQREIQVHREHFPGVPVVLDTTTDQALRVYERLGFRELGRRRIEAVTDAEGIKVPDAERIKVPEGFEGSSRATSKPEFSQRVLILEHEPMQHD